MKQKTKHPEWALKHKVRGTELRCIRGRYYLYNVTSKNCKKLKRAKKITLKQVGTICEKYGLIPTGMRRRGPIPAGCSPFKEEPKLESGFCDHFSKDLEDPRIHVTGCIKWLKFFY